MKDAGKERCMSRRQTQIACLIVLILAVVCAGMVEAAGRPDIVSYDTELLQDALSVHIRWQSAYPVVRAIVSAGDERQEKDLDPHDDNIKDAYGYHGEASFHITVDSRQFNNKRINYIIQIVDDAGKKSRRISGSLATAASDVKAEQEGGADQDMTPPVTDKGPGMIDKVLAVMERHDTPPRVESLTVNMNGTKGVSFSGRALDDKGLREVSIRIIDVQGEVVKEQKFSDPGELWQGTTDVVTLSPGSYTVVAQATDSAGNLSPEMRRNFSVGQGMKPDTMSPVTVLSPAGGTYQIPQMVTLTCADTGGAGCGATHYTTDGSLPTAASPRYAAPIPMTATTTLRFFSIDKAGNSEDAKTAFFTIEIPLVEPPSVSDSEPPRVTITLSAKATAGQGVTFTIEARGNGELQSLEYRLEGLSGKTGDEVEVRSQPVSGLHDTISETVTP